jgi:transcriptional regulator GlxA family with amidase domain
MTCERFICATAAVARRATLPPGICAMPKSKTSPPSRSSPRARHVSIVAVPDAAVSTLYGLYDVLGAYRMLDVTALGLSKEAPFNVQIVGENAGPLRIGGGVSIEVQHAIGDIDATDVIIVPSVLSDRWEQGRHPALVKWFARMHAQGALLCSACSGIFLLAETGLFDRRDATVHFNFARNFRATYPAVPVHPERTLVISGEREELITSGASATWHDMALYLYARFAGTVAAQEVARMFALQWHQDGLSPYIVFEGKADHGDPAIQTAQQWLARHFSVANPVAEMIKRSKLAERTFKRRFAAATGLTPIAYVQRLRVEDAKRRLERTDAAVDEVSWRVGYEDAAFFRRLFKRVTGLAPGEYRRRFRIPEFARP